jgi:hypothetical protein
MAWIQQPTYKRSGLRNLASSAPKPFWYGDVSYGKIPNYASDRSNTQSLPCYSSARRYCAIQNFPGVGTIQEMVIGVVALGCVSYAWYGVVQVTELQNHHPDCSSTLKSQDSECLAAIHRFCSANGLGVGGAIVESGGPNVVNVACIKAANYVSVKVN